ncbi:hypothetical protein VOLCADRAFT_84087 [Volvox carteri f. nagariensis]|uniref:EGF-like domain-containing protein n=1 Tax=Volvox carteri f. nagariensis TaxID=3068 RepID=D8UFH1_VOLCA|nr:uncharacterized protein VOLCADRAFT_84087 [Volvox carteri f. nagariensis]EFJ41457.1 hypothetical protein VOLCADRAFT_84087 [Volvox carteri f. nagariensis]|eukprot:XP_002957402.1 hypothetical protein VOLCADRAFT_84087 [Volvox carteri f. nagariensis]
MTLDGKDVQETCGQDHVCNVVTPNEPACFSAGIENMGSSAFHLNLLLISKSVDATVVLHGLLTNFTTIQDPATGATKVVPQVYPSSGAPYSFAAHTSYSSPSIQVKLTRRQLGYGSYTGMYVCATSNATTIISFRAAEHSCPFELAANGTLQLCSGRGSSGVCPHGTCACKAPYMPPVNWVVTPGLGFEDCRTALLPLQSSASLTVSELGPGDWAFFSVELSASAGRELHVWAAAAEATKGSLVLYLRHQQLPTDAAGQHDLASDAASAPRSASWWQDQSAHLLLRRKHPFFQPGTWYVGVHNTGLGPVSFTMGSAVYDCPNNCSGRGTCDANTGTCTCSQSTWPASKDCSIALHELAMGQAVDAPPRAFTYDALVLRGAREKLQASDLGRINLSVSFTTTDTDPQGLPSWVAGRPVLFVSPSLEAALNQSGGGDADGGGRPLHPQGAVESVALAARGATYSIEIGPRAVGDDGSLHVLVWNPLSSPLRQVGYSVMPSLMGECPADCSGHGTCNTTTGECTCEAPFLGHDCSVDPSTLVCTPGTRRAVRREGLRGTCWAPCRDNGKSFDDESCEELQCDGPREGHGQLRRKGDEVECVEDQCMAGNYTATDPSGDFLCTQRCACPADGAACTLEAACLPGTKQCLKGLRLAADGEKCIAAPCEEGSLRRAYDMDGGSAFSVCLCATAGDPASCAFTAPTQAAGNTNGVVSCLSGYERQGGTSSTRLSDGSTLVLGGNCRRPPRRGVSGGMVFFYCLLSIFLAAGLVVGGKYGVLWYEQYRYGRSVFSQGYVSWPLFGMRGNAGSATDDW